MYLRNSVLLAVVSLCAACCYAQRDVQISSILFIEGDAVFESIELTNFGDTTVDMSNWWFCSHDDNEQLVYDSGLGDSIAPGETISLRAFEFDVAQPFFGAEAYSLAIFDLSAGGFGGTANIVDHIQWSVGGDHNPTAAIRSQQAVNGGLWSAATDWISIDSDTGRINLLDETGGVRHGPDDYEVIRNIPFVPCDLNGDGVCDTVDVDIVALEGADAITSWLELASDFSRSTFVGGDLDLDGAVTSTDLGLLLNNFGRDGTLPYTGGNVNGDDRVDSTDLGLLLNNFGFGSAVSATSASGNVAVPEPVCSPFCVLLLFGLVARVAGRRR